MKTKLSNRWVRLAAYITGTLSAIVLIVCILGMILMYTFGTKDGALKSGYEVIASNYEAYIMTNYWNKPLEIEEELAKTNLYVTIIEDISSDEDGDWIFDDVSNHVYSNVPQGYDTEYAYIMEEGVIGRTYNYNIQYLLGALQWPYGYSLDRDYWPMTQIQKIVLDTTNNLFYIQTGVGYFPCEYIVIKEEGLRYDYSLGTWEGERCYYNSYYGRKLNTDNYASWTEIRVGDSVYKLDPNQTDNILIATADSLSIQQNLMETDFYYYDEETIQYRGTPEHYYTIAAAVNPALEQEDLFKEWSDLVTWFYSFEDTLVIYEIIAVIIFLASVAVLIHTAEDDKEKLKLHHKVPICIYLGCVILVEVALGALLGAVLQVMDNSWDLNISIRSAGLILAQIAALMMMPLLICISNLATRVKTKTVFRYSEFYYIAKPFVTLWRYAKENMSLFWKVTIGIIAVDIIQYIIMIASDRGYYYHDDEFIIWFFLYKIAEFMVILFAVMQMACLQKGSKRIANGDLSQPIDTNKMFWEFKKHGENINKMGDGIAKAVENQLKSERLKTELITNVSHDIKTPLTSIINYVDLIKKEEITEPTLCEYVDVLDRQSARLKKLIEDLMEASKASTGNLKVELEECDVSVLLTQVAGEFEDRFAVNELEAVIVKPEEPLFIKADGRHMWRVLDNLMNNIYKYSLPNSRVYIQLEQMGDKAVIQFKNISKTQLNISSDELMERFVRGDSSRNTEGSGLGLSIARSLTELMNGKMKLDIDGDLFKVTLSFQKLEKTGDYNSIVE